MKEIQVTLTRDEMQDVWFAIVCAEEEAEKENRKFTAHDLGLLREKFYNLLTNN